MGHRAVKLLVVVALVVAAAAAWVRRDDDFDAAVVTAAGDRNGLVARMSLTATRGSLVVETHVENRRREPVHLVPDQCGRITEVVLARTTFQPKGRAWTASLQAVKNLILVDQRLRQKPDRFHPRRPGDTSSNVPECGRPSRPIELAAAATVDERWELPFSYAYGLDAVGSANSIVRAEVVEARDPEELEFLDILITGEADAVRAGRKLRLEQPVASVVTRGPGDRNEAPSLGQLYDRLVTDQALRDWLAAQPADRWRDAHLQLSPDGIRFKAVTTLYERAVTATARPDATDVEVDLPGEADRARVFPRRPGTIPPGIRLIPEPGNYALADDVLAGAVKLPSGRIVVGEYLLDADPLEARAAPGAYPVHATLARYPGHDFEDVALATVVLSDDPTVRWRRSGAIAVDGGTAAITSAEGAAALRATFDRDEAQWERRNEQLYDSLTAHNHHVTLFALDDDVDLALFASGVGDGRYPVYVGLDASGRPTRVVIDFNLLHLDWP